VLVSSWSIRRPTGLDPRVVDALLAAALAGAGCIVGRQYHPAGWRPFDGWAYLLSILVSGPLAVRRRWPTAVLAVTCVAYVGYLALGYQPSLNFWGPIVALYTVASMRPARTAIVSAVATAAVIFYSGLAARVLSLEVCVAQAVLAPGIATMFGANTRLLAARNDQLASLTARLREGQRELARRAVVEERVRIARELHDVVAHHMSVVSVQAGLARYVLASDPAVAGTALDTIATASHEGLEEMRRLLLVLRVEPDAGHHPAPGLARIEDLVERVRAAGVPVDLVVHGHQRALLPGADSCAYRVVQEALTNVLKHARPTRVTVTLRYEENDLSVHIGDDGGGPPPAARADETAGHGLIGMRERAQLYGGTVTAGPRASGGFDVVLTLPTPESGA
jgi:signal transduction histidine kinase